MKDFKMYVGMTKENMTEVLHSALKNDAIPESFTVRHHVSNTGVVFPTRFVKIVPISAHGQSYHISVWFVAMTGIVEDSYVQQSQKAYEEYRETLVLQHILKHLRQRRMLSAFDSILVRSGLQVEHPLVTQLHKSIVLDGDWKNAEQILETMSQASLFDAYLHSSPPHSVWKRLDGTDADGDVPSPRGGHAMCIDHTDGMIYLLGGWDGEKSLDDFWVYDINKDTWRVLSHGTTSEPNAPGARSCHKMVFDSKTGNIYVLGRLSDADGLKPVGESRPVENRPSKPFTSEFYRYHTRGIKQGKWDFLSNNSPEEPQLVFDHQMVMDCEAQILYVFGGRVVDGDWDTTRFSGLYSYNVRLSKWRILQADETAGSSTAAIPSRFGHSMVFEPLSRTLFIFAGQRDERFLSDMYAYDIASQTATELYSNFTTSGGPDSCFTQRAVMDPQLKEIYVFCGLTRQQPAGSITVLQTKLPNWVYRYHPRPGKWTRILPEADYSARDRSEHMPVIEEPCPRYASQVVYDPTTRTVYMHGGNAGPSGAFEKGLEAEGDESDGKRLDDFWQMTLVRPDPRDIIRRATYKIRQQQFREICEDASPIKALNFLQTEVSSVVDHQDPHESEIFRTLLTYLLSPSSTLSDVEIESERLPPRKRSRPNTPEEDMTVPDQFVAPKTQLLFSVTTDSLLANADALEGNEQTASRFKQRSDVFESLLEFVSDHAKQPAGSLLDLVDRDISF